MIPTNKAYITPKNYRYICRRHGEIIPATFDVDGEPFCARCIKEGLTPHGVCSKSYENKRHESDYDVIILDAQ